MISQQLAILIGLCSILAYGERYDPPLVSSTVQATAELTPRLLQTECQNIFARYYEIPVGTVAMPNYSQLTPYFNESLGNIFFASGSSNLGGSGRAEYVGAVYQSSFRFPFPGVWSICLTSDNGSRMYFDDVLVESVSPSGTECLEVNVSSTRLVRSFRLEYFQTDGFYVLELTWAGPSTPRGVIPSCAYEPYVAFVPPTASPTRPQPCGFFGLNVFCQGPGNCGFFFRLFGINGCTFN
jgi:hypothetical protein